MGEGAREDDERLEVRDRIAIVVFYSVPDDTTVTKVRELIEGLTDITMDTLAALRRHREVLPERCPTCDSALADPKSGWSVTAPECSDPWHTR